jgi:hypothetical protein
VEGVEDLLDFSINPSPHYMDTLLQELQRIGRLMGHSIARQRLYTWRVTQTIEDDEDDHTHKT